jgi:CheY-like chemotaxis protein
MPKILIVEDYVDALELYGTYLRHQGYEVLSAADAIEGIVLARKHHPDVIVMDAGLPGMSGWEATRILKADPRTASIPVLMLTAHVLKESREEAEHAGVDLFVPKPALPDELHAEIRALLGDPQPTRAGRVAASKASTKRIARGRRRKRQL